MMWEEGDLQKQIHKEARNTFLFLATSHTLWDFIFFEINLMKHWMLRLSTVY
mgnify:CR=1 FL=1